MSDPTTTSEPTPTDPVFQPPDPAQSKAYSPGASAPSETAVDDGMDLEAARKLRSEARNLRARLKEAEEKARRLDEIEESNKTEAQKQAEQLDKLRQENERLQSQMLKAQVAADKGVPAELLSGTTEDELVASADRLLAFRGQQAAPEYGRSADASPTKPKQLTRADMSRMTTEQIVKADEAGLFDDLKAGRL